MPKEKPSRLKRPKVPMPDFVRIELDKNKLIGAYNDRPPYQRNDYLSWITRAKKEETRQRRLAQMIDELKAGDRYMKMAYRAVK